MQAALFRVILFRISHQDKQALWISQNLCQSKQGKPLEQGRQKFVWKRMRNNSAQQTGGWRCSDQMPAATTQESCGGNMIRQTVGTGDHDHGPVPESGGLSPQPSEHGRQDYVRERQKKAAVQRGESNHGSERAAPARQRDSSNAQPKSIATLSAQDGKQPKKSIARGTVPNGKQRIKEVPLRVKEVGRTSHQAVKGAESSGKALRAGGRSAQPMRQNAWAAVQARQRAVQAADAARRTAVTAGKAMAKAAASALRGAVSAIRSLAPLLASGGGAVFAVVLVLCLAGALLASPLGIFFSGGDSGGLTISAVVREIDSEYDARVEELKTGVTYDEVSLSGSRAPWVEILAVYAVKTATDLTDGQEVVTMTDGKKALLKQIFWDMNELSSFTSTVLGEEDDEEDTTTLYITITAKTAGEMADIYGFNDDQRRQLNELLSDEYREMWNDVL